jgi:DNA polymerase-3 subunit chi
MTRIDFYSLQKGSGGDRFLLTCRLVERIHAKGLRIFVHLPDRAQAQHLDRLLWTYREQSFLPHGVSSAADRDLTPILIDHEAALGDEDQVLINLRLDVPSFFGRFKRLCEPVDQDPVARNAGRARFRYYRDRGYELHHHEIRF